MAIEAWTGTYEDLPLGAEESASQLIDGSAIDAFLVMVIDLPRVRARWATCRSASTTSAESSWMVVETDRSASCAACGRGAAVRCGGGVMRGAAVP